MLNESVIRRMSVTPSSASILKIRGLKQSTKLYCIAKAKQHYGRDVDLQVIGFEWHDRGCFTADLDILVSMSKQDYDLFNRTREVSYSMR